MNDERIHAALGSLDPAQHLSDEAIDGLFPFERLEARVAAGRDEIVVPIASRSTRRISRLTVAASAATGVAAMVAAVSFAVLPAAQVATVHQPKVFVGPNQDGVAVGVNTADTVAKPIYGPVGKNVPECRASQIAVTLTANRDRTPATAGWTGEFWYRNKGPSCSMPMTEISIQPVTGAHHSPIGSASPNDSVARSPFLLVRGGTAFANASLVATGLPAPQHAHGTIGNFCAPRKATGIVLIGYEHGWPNYYFSLSHHVDVCTKWFLGASGGILRLIPKGMK